MNVVEVLVNTKVYVDAVDAALDHLRYQDVFMHGQNVIHLATEYSQECLEYICFGFGNFLGIGDHLEDKMEMRRQIFNVSSGDRTSGVLAIGYLFP